VPCDGIEKLQINCLQKPAKGVEPFLSKFRMDCPQNMKLAKIVAVLSFVLAVNFRLHATDASDLATELQALETADTTPASDVTIGGVYYSAKLVNVAGAAGLLPFPTSMNYPAWNLGDNVWLMDDLPTATPAARSGARAMAEGVPDFSDTNKDDSEPTNISYLSLPPINTNVLWLQITNVSNGLVYANLNMATDTVYAIWSTTNLLSPWQVECEVWPTNGTMIPAVTPFSLQNFGRQNLFLRAEDWTGVTENGNTVPDWWFWMYFGTTALYDTNLDSQGNTLLSDYEDGTDPNIIQFTLSAASFYVNQTFTSAQINLLAGTPSYYAILVNDTNYADANWQAYTGTNITVNLGSTDGVYNVIVGLRGLPQNATPTWETLQFTLMQTPPPLVVTSPTNNTVMLPMIQVTGYSPRALASISYDITNALGLVTNQQVLVLDQYYDTNIFEFTTNTFQAFDVPLTNGLNTITFHATDLAGNVVVTNINFTLDYSSKTNPPVVQITWPQNGTQVSGTNFTLDGCVDDPTATVAVSITDTNGDTNLVNGAVERTGKFWAEEIPLNAGTNNLTLTVTDAAGNVTVTNISVVQTSITLTMDDISDTSQLWQPTVNLTGKISDSTYAIWVNGIKGHNNGDGTWYANNVPVNKGGTASFTMTGYAPSEQQPDGSYGN
jgi:hypothetical protein